MYPSIIKISQFINKHLLLLCACLFAIRGSYLFINQLDLIGDETYYWDWSRQLDWCYYSKPPMVAWLIRLFTELGGNSVAIVRLPTVVLGTIFLAYFYATTKAIYNAQTAALALLMILATPANLIANFIMTIDPPLYCFWIMSIYFLQQALFKRNLLDWLWAGMATGAALLSKQVALLIPLMLIGYLLMDKQRYPSFKKEFFIYLTPIVLCMIPILLWNQNHDWVMYNHSKGHFSTQEQISLLKKLEQSYTVLLYQLLLLTPIIATLITINSFKLTLKLKHLSAQEQFLVWMGPILLIGFIVINFFQKTQGNWPMPFYFTGIMLLSAQWQKGQWQKTIKYGLMIGYFMVILTYSLPLLIQFFKLQNTAIDPTYRFRNTQEFVNHITKERQRLLTESKADFILTIGHRYLASQLAFYLPEHPQIYRYENKGGVYSQYEIWPGPTKYIGKTALIITDKASQTLPKELTDIFNNIEKISEIHDPTDNNKKYGLYLAEGLKSWPAKAASLQTENNIE